MANNFTRFRKGLNIKQEASSSASEAGDLDVSGGKLNYHNGTDASPLVSEAHTATLTNKTISADVNTLSNIVDSCIKAGAAIAYSKLALTGNIVDSDINASAAIAYSKLALTGNVVDSDIASSAAIAYSKLALSGSIVNADIASNAAIAYSKLAALTASKALVSDASGVVSASTVTSTELGYLSGATSNIQNQINSLSGGAITGLTGDVSATGPGNASVTVNFVGASTASEIHTATVGTLSATNVNTPSAIVKRDASGNFSAGTITANLTGNVSGSAASITGNLTGDVTSTGMSTTVASVGGSSAANIHTAEQAANAATNANTSSTIVKRDASGNFSAGTITANITGNVSGTAASITGNLTGDVTSTGMSTTIAAGAVSNSKMANMAAHTFKGNNTGSSAAPSDLTATQLTAELNAFVGDSGSGGTKGLVPAPASGDAAAGRVLKADGTWGAAGTASPLTTKGDLYVYDTGNARFPVGSDGQVLTADSSQTSGLKWNTPSSSGGGQAISNTYGPVSSTAGQTSITLPFSVTTAAAFFLSVDGKILSQGSSADYTISGSTVTLNQALAANLNIQAWYFGTITVNTSPSPKNYITYGNFENNATTGWSLYHTTLSSLVPNQTAGSWTSAAGTLALSAVSSGKLAGTYSMQMASSAATTAGDMLVSQATSIDIEDQAKVLSFKFAYKVASGTVNMSGTSSNTWAVYIYDVTNSAWIQPTGCYNLVQSTGVGIAQGTFQTPSNMTQFQIALVNINATSGAVTLLLDDFYVGPQSLAYGPPISDWKSYTPASTAGWGNATTNLQWRQVGGSVEVQGTIVTGTTVASEARISLPSVTSDSSLPTLSHRGIYARSAASGNHGGLVLIEPSVGYVTFSDPGILGSSAVSALSKANGSSIAGSGETITINFSVPIAGWSSNTVMSADSDTRVCAARATYNAAGTIGSSGQSIIPFNAVDFDTHAAFSTSSNAYVVPVTGKYRVSTALTFTPSGTTASQACYAYLFKNGALHSQLGQAQTRSTSSAIMANGSALVDCKAGDTLAIYVSNSTSSTITFDAAATDNWVTFERLSGPATVAASESIVAIYNGSSTTVGTSLTQIAYSTKVKDSHNAYNSSTGVYTIPTSGTYNVSAAFCYTDSNTSVVSRNVSVYQNGVAVLTYAKETPGAASAAVSYPVNGLISCNAGDTIAIKGVASVSVALGAGVTNYFCINRVGN
jgi:hypothetical protein